MLTQLLEEEILGNCQTMIFFGRTNTVKSLCPRVVTVPLLAKLCWRSSVENPNSFLGQRLLIYILLMQINKQDGQKDTTREKEEKKPKQEEKSKPLLFHQVENNLFFFPLFFLFHFLLSCAIVSPMRLGQSFTTAVTHFLSVPGPGLICIPSAKWYRLASLPLSVEDSS